MVTVAIIGYGPRGECVFGRFLKENPNSLHICLITSGDVKSYIS